jgi:hypothetical protein
MNFRKHTSAGPAVLEDRRHTLVVLTERGRQLAAAPVASTSDLDYPERRDGEANPHRCAADHYTRLAKIDLRLLARRRLEPHRRTRLGAQRLPQRCHRPLDGAQVDHNPVFACQVLAHHIRIGAMSVNPFREPRLQPVKPAAAARRSITRPPKPFIWTKDPEKIIAAVKRVHQLLDSIH